MMINQRIRYNDLGVIYTVNIRFECGFSAGESYRRYVSFCEFPCAILDLIWHPMTREAPE